MIHALIFAALVQQGQAALVGITLGSSVAAAIERRGDADVVTTDVGQVWTWPGKDGGLVRVTTGDDGAVQIVDVLAGPSDRSAFGLPAAAAVRLQFNATTVTQALSTLSALADGSGSATFPDSGKPAFFQAYKLTPERELVLLFDRQQPVLREAFYGLRGALARGGLVPDEGKTPAFKAPALEKLGDADYNGPREGVAYVRIAVGNDGAVTGATIFVSSGDSQLDRIAVAGAMHDRFSPATLDGTAVASTYYYKETFTIAQPQTP